VNKIEILRVEGADQQAIADHQETVIDSNGCAKFGVNIRHGKLRVKYSHFYLFILFVENLPTCRRIFAPFQTTWTSARMILLGVADNVL